MASGTARVSVHAWCLVQYGVYVLVMCAPVSCCLSGHMLCHMNMSVRSFRRVSDEKERKKTDNPREGWEDGTPPPHRDFKEGTVWC